MDKQEYGNISQSWISLPGRRRTHERWLRPDGAVMSHCVAVGAHGGTETGARARHRSHVVPTDYLRADTRARAVEGSD